MTVPVVFHVFTGRDSTGTLEGTLTDTQIEVQVDSLTRAFANTGISFQLLGISRQENTSLFYDMFPSHYGSVAQYLHVDPLHVMNFYVGHADGYGGAVPFLPPSSSVGTPGDRVFLNWRDFPNSDNPNRADGNTGVHEAGHYFGLPHTWGSSCSSDDGFSDTGQHNGPDGGFACFSTPLPNDCVDSPIDLPNPVFNYMNYTLDVCKDEFSFDQNVYQDQIQLQYRTSLGDVIPTVYDARSAPITFNNPTFSDEHIYVLPGADVTVTGVVTLLNGASFVAAGGTNLDGITGLDLQNGSLFDIRGYDTPLYFSGDVTVSGGSTLRLGRQRRVLQDYLATPSLSVAGNVTVTGDGSTLDIGSEGEFSLGASSVAQFDDGGRYTSWGTISLGSYAQLVMESDAGAPYNYSQFVDTAFALGPDARLIFRNGGFDFGGNPAHRLIVRRLNPNEAWDRIAFEGDDVSLDYATIEGGTTGALVRARGVVFDNVTFSGNDDGVETDYTVASSGGIGTPMRSELALSNVHVEGSAFAGLYLRNADASITASVVEHNAYYGVYASNATLDPLTLNEVTASGFDSTGTPIPGATGDGIWIGADGDVYLGELPSTSPSAASSFNFVTDNRDDEIETAPGAYLFLGWGSNGDNAVFKSGGIPAGTYLINNVDRSPVLAENVYWGDSGGPPTEAFFYEPLIDYDPFLKNAPVPPPPPPPPPPCHPRCSEDDLAAEAASRLGPSGDTAARGGDGQGERLRERIRELRQQIAADPTHPRARRLLRALYRLQRLDRHDVLGERAETMALLTGLRTLLGEDPMPPPLRRAAEQALRAEVADALRAEDYDEAEALLADYGPLVDDDETRYGLLLSAASVDEQRGRYAEAVAKINEVLAVLPPEAEELALALGHEVAVIERRMSEGGTGRAAGKAATSEAARNTSASAPTAFALKAAYPNPFDASAVVPFEIPEATEVRVAVYDLLGREVAVLTEGRREAGRYRVRFDASDLASWVYVVRAVMTSESSGALRAFSQKLTVVK